VSADDRIRVAKITASELSQRYGVSRKGAHQREASGDSGPLLEKGTSPHESARRSIMYGLNGTFWYQDSEVPLPYGGTHDFYNTVPLGG
jgi:hypothetical protein